MSRLAQQRFEEWVPLRDQWTIGMLDRTADECAAAFGWQWDRVDVDGLGPMLYVPLAWDGRSRFLLSVSEHLPEYGIAIEAARDDDPAGARADLRTSLQLDAKVFLAISEGEAWFARWDPPHTGGRPATAHPR